MKKSLELVLCVSLVVYLLPSAGYASEEDVRHLSSTEVGSSVLFSCKGDDCGIDEEHTMSNIQTACKDKNKLTIRSKEELKLQVGKIRECSTSAFKEMKSLYSYYY